MRVEAEEVVVVANVSSADKVAIGRVIARTLEVVGGSRPTN